LPPLTLTNLTYQADVSHTRGMAPDCRAWRALRSQQSGTHTQ